MIVWALDRIGANEAMDTTIHNIFYKKNSTVSVLAKSASFSRAFITFMAGTMATMLSLALVVPDAQARDMRSVRPEREGFDVARLQQIDTYMNQQVEAGVMVGGLGMIARNGNIVYSSQWGESDREASKPMTADAIFRIYSMTKPITGVALMMLHEEGKFLLNDPVAKYLPELANLSVSVSTADGTISGVSDGTQNLAKGEEAEVEPGTTRQPKRQPTIRDLMRHTAGFTYGVFGNTEVDKAYRDAGLLRDHPDLTDFVAKLGKIPLQYEPGERWHYSVSVDVQGALVERLSGMRFSEFLKTRIFEPLGMPDTSFTIRPDKRDRFAQMYAPKGTPAGLDAWITPNASSELEVAPEFANRGFQPGASFESGGGGLISTAMDYLRFSQMMLNGGELDGVRLLAPGTVELMSRDHMGDVTMGFGRKGMGFGLDFAVIEDPGTAGDVGAEGEYSWGGAAGTRFWIDPKNQMVGVFMVQILPHRTDLASKFKVLSYAALTEASE